MHNSVMDLATSTNHFLKFSLTKLYLQLTVCRKMKKSDKITFAIKQLVILFNEYWKELKL